MTQPMPPQPPTDGNPYAQQPPAGAHPYGQQPPVGAAPYGQQPGGGNPFGAPQQAGGFPPPPPAPVRSGNVALGIVVAVVAALVTAGIYGAIIGGTEKQIGYAAIGVGFLVGFAAGKVGGANPALPLVSALLSVGAVYLGQLIGAAMILSDLTGTSASSVFFDHFSDLTKAWQEAAEAMDYLFLAIGGVAAFSGAKKAAA
ncbi:hypothetical protein [Streptomyces sp. enrichment culture]|uniref:hypothetical protein n=1 Tax=Streptomyces sp. enrichment culture TaxID=1795815 RepID=UPI003F56CF54